VTGVRGETALRRLCLLLDTRARASKAPVPLTRWQRWLKANRFSNGRSPFPARSWTPVGGWHRTTPTPTARPSHSRWIRRRKVFDDRCHSPRFAAASAGSSAGATSACAAIVRAQLFHLRMASSLAGGRSAAACSKCAIASVRHS